MATSLSLLRTHGRRGHLCSRWVVGVGVGVRRDRPPCWPGHQNNGRKDQEAGACVDRVLRPSCYQAARHLLRRCEGNDQFLPCPSPGSGPLRPLQAWPTA